MLNALAFVLIGIQLRLIWERLGSGTARTDAVVIAAVVLGVAIATQFLWVMTYSALVMRHNKKIEPAKACEAS